MTIKTTHTRGPLSTIEVNPTEEFAGGIGPRFAIEDASAPEDEIRPIIGYAFKSEDAELWATAPDLVAALAQFLRAYSAWNARREGGENDLHAAAGVARVALTKTQVFQ